MIIRLSISSYYVCFVISRQYEISKLCVQLRPHIFKVQLFSELTMPSWK